MILFTFWIHKNVQRIQMFIWNLDLQERLWNKDLECKVTLYLDSLPTGLYCLVEYNSLLYCFPILHHCGLGTKTSQLMYVSVIISFNVYRQFKFYKCYLNNLFTEYQNSELPTFFLGIYLFLSFERLYQEPNTVLKSVELKFLRETYRYVMAKEWAAKRK